jgi:hypothetical protein
MKNNHLAIVAFWYLSFCVIDLIDAEPTAYYLSYCALFLATSYICSLSDKKLILCYGILNVLALWLHIPLVFVDFEMAFYLFYDAMYGVGNWIIAVELLMIGFGSYNAIIYFIDSWRDNGVSWYRHIVRNI